MILKQLLDQEVQVRKAYTSPPSDAHSWGASDLVLKYGRIYQFQPKPNKFKWRIPKLCYKNSRDLVVRSKNLIYVEGYALNSKVPVPILHAWCVRPNSDIVIDVTTEWFDEYLGIPFTREYLSFHWKNWSKKCTSLVDNYAGGYPLYYKNDEQMKEVIHE